MNKSLKNILDTMTGADGGIKFVKFKMLVEDMENRINNGDKQADQILDIMDKFSKLIDFSCENMK